jgi:hypothetical protein
MSASLQNNVFHLSDGIRVRKPASLGVSENLLPLLDRVSTDQAIDIGGPSSPPDRTSC